MAKGKKICILSDQHLSANPRVWKEADALARHGYDITILTRFNSAEHLEKDYDLLKKLHPSIKYRGSVNVVNDGNNQWYRLFCKGREKLASLFKQVAGIDSKFLLTTDPGKMLKDALAYKADLYIGHVEVGLYAGIHLSDLGYKVAFDFEDWYSEDYINHLRPVKLLKKLESQALQAGVFVICPSQAMAKALQTTYKVASQPDVIYNGFAVEEVQQSESHRTEGYVALLWFSQTIGAGRGIEKIVDALKRVKTPVKLLLLGKCSEEYKNIIKSIFPYTAGHLLEILEPVKHAELHGLIQQCDIGLALEDVYPQSRNKTITNKILQYLQAGIKVFATDTDGQKEVARLFPGSVKTGNAKNSADWHIGIEDLISKKVDSTWIIEQYNAHLGWEAQEKKLLELVENAMHN